MSKAARGRSAYTARVLTHARGARRYTTMGVCLEAPPSLVHQREMVAHDTCPQGPLNRGRVIARGSKTSAGLTEAGQSTVQAACYAVNKSFS